MVGSFYLINNSQSSLYLEIKEKSKKYKKNPKDALIINNSIIPGKSGIKVNIKKTYRNMKKYRIYNETLNVYEEVKPTISVTNIYDKYIEKGNSLNREVSLVFPITLNNHFNKIINILNNNQVVGNFFIDGYLLSEEEHSIRINNNHSYSILSYNSSYDDTFMKTSISFLESITKRENNFCYSNINNKKLLDFCSKMFFHTIKPSLIIDKSLYKIVKENITNSIIISIEDNSYNIKELDSTIKYIKSKGYKIVSLDKLISENY